MKRNLLIIILFLLSIQLNQSFAQNRRRCGTNEYMARLKREDPTLEARLQQTEQLIQQASLQSQTQKTGSTNTVITIPVVFHLLYKTSVPAQNIPDNRIIDQLAALNADYARLNADSVHNIPVSCPWRTVATNTQIQFCLAQRDPSGNATNGIHRVVVTASGFDPLTNDNAKYTSLGGTDAWPRAQYLNVWIVNWSGTAASYGLLGITQMPGGAAATDGLLVKYTTVGGTTYHGTEPSYNLGRTLTHEVGHWLGLRHIWGDDDNQNGTCESATECSGTDYVTDTPNQGEENYGGASLTFPHIDCCSTASGGDPTNGVMFMNYMDYTDDGYMNMFTAGQSTRMHSAITTSRATIPTSNGCLAISGIADIHSQILELNAYPNPTSGILTITGEFFGMTDAVVTISNMVGEMVYTKEIKNVSNIRLPVNLSGMAQGVYNLSLRTSHNIVNKKVMLTN